MLAWQRRDFGVDGNNETTSYERKIGNFFLQERLVERTHETADCVTQLNATCDVSALDISASSIPAPSKDVRRHVLWENVP